MSKQCDFCFQHKDTLLPVLDKLPVRVCKACLYKIGQVTGFLEYHKVRMVYQPELSVETPPTPPATIKKSSARKRKALPAKDNP